MKIINESIVALIFVTLLSVVAVVIDPSHRLAVEVTTGE